MKKGFFITNVIAAVLAVGSLGWLIYDFVIYSFLHSKMLQLEPLTPADEKLGIRIWFGLLIFLVAHITAWIAIAGQFQFFRKATLLRVLALVLSIISCVFILNDIACLSDIGKEYQEGLEVEFEWTWLYWSSFLHGFFFIAMMANLIEAWMHQRRLSAETAALKDEVVFIVVHCVGVICGGIGLLSAYATFIETRTHAILQYTFPLMFALTLIPYAFLSGYWLIMKIKERPKEWYDEKQFRDISRAGLITMFATIPFLAFLYISNYNPPLGPIHILWFPFYLYFVIFIFSCFSLYFNWKN